VTGARVRRPADLVAGPPTPGVERLEAFADEGRWVGFTRTEPGVFSGWHHHGGHDTYFYVLSGAARIELAGGESVEVRAGDFAHLPAGVVHREGTPGHVPLEAVVIRLGSGPQVFPVDDPRAGSGEG